jgi:hypothetical protein
LQRIARSVAISPVRDWHIEASDIAGAAAAMGALSEAMAKTAVLLGAWQKSYMESL